eukprot:g1383.t1
MPDERREPVCMLSADDDEDEVLVLIIANSPASAPLPAIAAEVKAYACIPRVRCVLNVGAAGFCAALERHRPRVLVLSGHGDAQFSGCFTFAFAAPSLDGGSLCVLHPDTLAAIVAQHTPRNGGRLVACVLNGCQTYELGLLLQQRAGVRFVSCWRTFVDDTASRVFSTALVKQVSMLQLRPRRRAPSCGWAWCIARAFAHAEAAVGLEGRPGSLATGQRAILPRFALVDPHDAAAVDQRTYRLSDGRQAAGVPVLLPEGGAVEAEAAAEAARAAQARAGGSGGGDGGGEGGEGEGAAGESAAAPLSPPGGRSFSPGGDTTGSSAGTASAPSPRMPTPAAPPFVFSAGRLLVVACSTAGTRGDGLGRGSGTERGRAECEADTRRPFTLRWGDYSSASDSGSDHDQAAAAVLAHAHLKAHAQARAGVHAGLEALRLLRAVKVAPEPGVNVLCRPSAAALRDTLMGRKPSCVALAFAHRDSAAAAGGDAGGGGSDGASAGMPGRLLARRRRRRRRQRGLVGDGDGDSEGAAATSYLHALSTLYAIAPAARPLELLYVGGPASLEHCKALLEHRRARVIVAWSSRVRASAARAFGELFFDQLAAGVLPRVAFDAAVARLTALPAGAAPGMGGGEREWWACVDPEDALLTDPRTGRLRRDPRRTAAGVPIVLDLAAEGCRVWRTLGSHLRSQLVAFGQFHEPVSGRLLDVEQHCVPLRVATGRRLELLRHEVGSMDKVNDREMQNRRWNIGALSTGDGGGGGGTRTAVAAPCAGASPAPDTDADEAWRCAEEELFECVSRAEGAVAAAADTRCGRRSAGFGASAAAAAANGVVADVGGGGAGGEHAVLLGPAASGKTTTMYKFMHRCLRAALQDPAKPVPVFVHVYKLAALLEQQQQQQRQHAVSDGMSATNGETDAHPGALFEAFLRREHDDDVACELTRLLRGRTAGSSAGPADAPRSASPADHQCQHQQPVIVLFDGLDEGGHFKPHIERAIAALMRLRHLRVIVSSRETGFDQRAFGGAMGRLLEVLPLTPAMKWEAIQKRLLGGTRATVGGGAPTAASLAKCTALYRQVDSRYRELSRNPLLLSLMIKYYEDDGGSLPRSRYALYERGIDYMLVSYEGVRRRDRGGRARTAEELHDFRRDARAALARVAAGVHVQRRARDVRVVVRTGAPPPWQPPAPAGPSHAQVPSNAPTSDGERPLDMDAWGEDDVVGWLQEIRLSQFVAAAREFHVDGAELARMIFDPDGDDPQREALADLGVVRMIHVNKLKVQASKVRARAEAVARAMAEVGTQAGVAASAALPCTPPPPPPPPLPPLRRASSFGAGTSGTAGHGWEELQLFPATAAAAGGIHAGSSEPQPKVELETETETGVGHEMDSVELNRVFNELLQRRCGLLAYIGTQRQPDGTDVKLYRFPHLTFQEHFVAQHMAEKVERELAALRWQPPSRAAGGTGGEDAESLVFERHVGDGKVFDVWHREVVVFLAGALSADSFERFARYLVRADDGSGAAPLRVFQMLRERGLDVGGDGAAAALTAEEAALRARVLRLLQGAVSARAMASALLHPSAELRDLALTELREYRIEGGELEAIAGAVLAQVRAPGPGLEGVRDESADGGEGEGAGGEPDHMRCAAWGKCCGDDGDGGDAMHVDAGAHAGDGSISVSISGSSSSSSSSSDDVEPRATARAAPSGPELYERVAGVRSLGVLGQRLGRVNAVLCPLLRLWRFAAHPTLRTEAAKAVGALLSALGSAGGAAAVHGAATRAAAWAAVREQLRAMLAQGGEARCGALLNMCSLPFAPTDELRGDARCWLAWLVRGGHGALALRCVRRFELEPDDALRTLLGNGGGAAGRGVGGAGDCAAAGGLVGEEDDARGVGAGTQGASTPPRGGAGARACAGARGEAKPGDAALQAAALQAAAQAVAALDACGAGVGSAAGSCSGDLRRFAATAAGARVVAALAAAQRSHENEGESESEHRSNGGAGGDIGPVLAPGAPLPCWALRMELLCAWPGAALCLQRAAADVAPERAAAARTALAWLGAHDWAEGAAAAAGGAEGEASRWERIHTKLTHAWLAAGDGDMDGHAAAVAAAGSAAALRPFAFEPLLLFLRAQRAGAAEPEEWRLATPMRALLVQQRARIEARFLLRDAQAGEFKGELPYWRGAALAVPAPRPPAAVAAAVTGTGGESGGGNGGGAEGAAAAAAAARAALPAGFRAELDEQLWRACHSEATRAHVGDGSGAIGEAAPAPAGGAGGAPAHAQAAARLAEARRCLAAGASPTAHRDVHGGCALHRAAIGGLDGCLEAMLAVDAGAVDVRDAVAGNTPLHYAASYGHAELVLALLWRGADPCAANNAHYGPLHLASLEGRLDCARELLDAGADPAVRGAGFVTPLRLAERHQKGQWREVAVLLRERVATL